MISKSLVEGAGPFALVRIGKRGMPHTVFTLLSLNVEYIA